MTVSERLVKLYIGTELDVRSKEPLNKSAAALSGSFAATFRLENLEIHKVFLRFPNLNLQQNLSPTALADLFRASFVYSDCEAGNGMSMVQASKLAAFFRLGSRDTEQHDLGNAENIHKNSAKGQTGRITDAGNLIDSSHGNNAQQIEEKNRSVYHLKYKHPNAVWPLQENRKQGHHRGGKTQRYNKYCYNNPKCTHLQLQFSGTAHTGSSAMKLIRRDAENRFAKRRISHKLAEPQDRKQDADAGGNDRQELHGSC